MPIYQRTNPKDLDGVIARFQTQLYDFFNLNDYACFDRVYNNSNNSNGSTPEAYTLNGDYLETLYNDNFSMSSFCIDDPSRKVLDNQNIEVKVSVIFQVNLVNVLPSITHRADEEFNNMVTVFSQNYSNDFEFKFTGFETTIAKVYREFDRKQIRFDDMSEKYDVRFNYIAQYKPFKGTFCD